jgi:hypothetical protein
VQTGIASTMRKADTSAGDAVAENESAFATAA